MPPELLKVFESLLPVIVGALLALLAMYVSNQQSRHHAVELTRDQRRYELGGAAYKQGIGAIDKGIDSLFDRRGPITGDVGKVVVEVARAIEEARLNLGLEMNKDMMSELLTALLVGPTTLREGEELGKARDKSIELLHRHRNEILSAWRDVLGMRTQ